MQRQITILLIIFSQIFQLYGQSIKISPENPSPDDCIYIHAEARTANLAFISESQITKEGNNIIIEACFYESAFNAIDTHYDTIALGALELGEYQLDYLVSSVRGEMPCEEAEQVSTQINFEVKENSLPDLACHTLEIDVFPNPITANDYLHLTANESISRVDVFDSTGNFIYGKSTRGSEYQGNSNYLFPVPEIYYLRINGNSPNSITVKVIRL